MKHSIPAALAASFLALALLSGCPSRTKGERVVPVDGRIVIDAAGLSKGDVRFYSYPADGRQVDFFVARSRTGELKTAFDACAACFAHKMGYRAGKGSVTCVYCGNVFTTEQLDTGMGSCIPIRIPHVMDGDRVVMQEADVRDGARWF